jgi:hypothetical protein
MPMPPSFGIPFCEPYFDILQLTVVGMPYADLVPANSHVFRLELLHSHASTSVSDVPQTGRQPAPSGHHL